MQLLSPTIKNRLNSWNPLPYIRSFFQSEIREEILKGIDIRLLYFDGELINLENGSAEKADINPQSIACATLKLISEEKDSKGNAVSSSKKKTNNKSIALFLPLTEFIYTKYSMPGVDSANIKAALSYQRDEFLPASSEHLQLTVKHIKQDSNYALWFSENNTENFYLAFHQQGLILSTILPNFSLLSSKTKSHLIKECSDSYIAQYNFSDYSLSQIGHILASDLKTEDFKKEWESSFGLLENATPCLKSKANWIDYLADNQTETNYKQSVYAYFPQQVKKKFKSKGHLRNSRVIGLMAFIFIFMAAIPFVDNERKYWKSEKKYNKYLALSKDIREQRSKVLTNEEEWGLYINYPKVNILEVITRLNKIIPLDSWISSFKIKNGYVEIDGYSPNPTAILEVISGQSDFNEVAFNQNTRAQRGKDKEKFGITFHIKNVDVDEYEKIYFSDN
jgi:hypothetical protein